MDVSCLKKVAINTVAKVNSFGKKKIFCVGLNKTGTTSVKKAWSELGIVVGNQAQARNLLDPWLKRDFAPIVRYCKSAQAFQDSPFSFPYTWVALDYAFPQSKFILTVRNNPEQWYRSITKFHSKLWGSNGYPPTMDELKQAVNGTMGRPWIVNQALFNTPSENPYKKENLIKFYENHVNQVKEYFKYRPDDLLIIDLSESTSYERFCKFLGKNPVRDKFPWENKT